MRRTVPAICGGVGVGVERALGECHRLPHKDFSDLYEKMSAEGESASETHLHHGDDVAELEGERRALVGVRLIRMVRRMVRHKHVLVSDTVQRLCELEHVDIAFVRPDLLEVVQATGDVPEADTHARARVHKHTRAHTQREKEGGRERQK